MAKITIPNITAGYASVAALNENFQAIEDALNNQVLYRSSPVGEANHMSSDLDMNGNRILNALATSGEGFVWFGPWTTATPYQVNSLVSSSGSTYICVEAHTSSNFGTDLGLGKWEVLASQGAAGAGTGDMLKSENLSGLADVAVARANISAVASTDDTTWTGSQRGALVAENDLSIDLNASNNFTCTTSTTSTLTFTNMVAGQSGWIKFVITGTPTISAHANTQISTANLAKLGVAGTYVGSYFCDGTDVYVSLGVYA